MYHFQERRTAINIERELKQIIESVDRSEKRIAYLEGQLSVLMPSADDEVYGLPREYHHLIRYAEETYELYKDAIKTGNRRTSIRSICKLVFSGQVTAEGLRLCISNYIKKVASDKTKMKYRIAPHNFFGQAGRWAEFVETEKVVKPADQRRTVWK